MDVTTLHTIVHWTARASALLFAAALLAPTFDVALRRAFSLFSAFIVAHTIHFGFVVWMALATGGAGMFPGGQSIAQAGGWPAVAAIFSLFYVLAVTSWFARYRGQRASRALRVSNRVATVFLGSMFVETYVRLIERSAWFAVPAALVGVGVLFDSVGPLLCRVWRLPLFCRQS